MLSTKTSQMHASATRSSKNSPGCCEHLFLYYHLHCCCCSCCRRPAPSMLAFTNTLHSLPLSSLQHHPSTISAEMTQNTPTERRLGCSFCPPPLPPPWPEEQLPRYLWYQPLPHSRSMWFPLMMNTLSRSKGRVDAVGGRNNTDKKWRKHVYNWSCRLKETHARRIGRKGWKGTWWSEFWNIKANPRNLKYVSQTSSFQTDVPKN